MPQYPVRSNFAFRMRWMPAFLRSLKASSRFIKGEYKAADFEMKSPRGIRLRLMPEFHCSSGMAHWVPRSLGCGATYVSPDQGIHHDLFECVHSSGKSSVYVVPQISVGFMVGAPSMHCIMHFLLTSFLP